jgi:serine protease Do
MPETVPDQRRTLWIKRGRAAAVGIGLGALALTPMVWAETPPTPTPSATPAASPSATPSATMTAPVALMQQESFAPLVKKVLPAVVNISVTEKPEAGVTEEFGPGFSGSPFDQFLRRFFQQQQGDNGMPQTLPNNPNSGVKRIALGSGFIISPQGDIVTNNHVIGEAAKVEVIMQDGTRYPAKIIGRDPKTDLAVLKIDAHKALPYVAFGDSKAAQVGDWVVAVGNPFGLGGTVTTGIISARGRDIHSGEFDDFLQIDAPINRGNSGGPTFNLQGQVIGINTAIYSPNGGSVGIGFAIPSNVAKTIVAQLEAHGKVSRGWLGVQIQEVTPAIAASLGLHNDHGALVALVTPDSPAAKAGLKQGDVIMSFNGTPVDHLRDLPRLVADTAPNSEASIGVWRKGETSKLEVKVGQYHENQQVASADTGKPEQADALGLHFSALTKDLRHELDLGKTVHGVVITGVDNGSIADNLGLRRGDVLVSINQQPVETPREAASKLNEIAHSSQKNALLLLERHGVIEYVGADLGNNQG